MRSVVINHKVFMILRNTKRLYIKNFCGRNNKVKSESSCYLKRIEVLRIKRLNNITNNYVRSNSLRELKISHSSNTTNKKIIKNKLTNLRVLHLRNCNYITDESVIYLPNLNNLRVREESNLITSTFFNRLKNLQVLNIVECSKLNDKLALFLKSSGQVVLHTLIIDACAVTNNLFKHLSDKSGKVNSLKKLEIQRCKNITDDVGLYLPNLHTLDICASAHNIHSITNELFKNLASASGRVVAPLKQLTIYGCSRRSFYSSILTNDLFVFVSNIEILSLYYCDWFTSEGLKFLPNLQKILLRKCNNITNDIVTDIITYSPNVETIDLLDKEIQITEGMAELLVKTNVQHLCVKGQSFTHAFGSPTISQQL